MEKRWSGLLLLVLVLLSVSIHCCYALKEGDSQVLRNEEAELEDEDDLEDLDEGFEDVGGPRDSFFSEEAMAASKVANVNDQDAERVVANFEYVLLVGYAPWCTQSQELLPEFAAAAVRLSQLGNPTVLAKVDAVNNPSAASRYEIRGYPTVVFFLNGTREAYNGGFSREEIVLWVRKKTGSAVTTIASKEEAESFLSKKVTAVLGYFDKLEGPENDAFIAAAKAQVDTEFVQTTVAEVAQAFIKPPFIAVRKPEPEHFSAFGGGFNSKEITSFVEINKHPLLTFLNSKNANTVYSSPLKLHVLLFAENKDYENVKSIILEAAKDFKGKVMFLVIDMEDKDFAMPMLAVYGLDTNKPVVAGLDNEDGSRYLLQSDLTVENLKKFAADFYTRKLPLYFKSEPVPAENAGLVKKVVGKTFDEIVLDDTKDVFLEVHAPWCPSCEKVGRVFDKLAKHAQEVPSLVLAKYDAQANEHPFLMDVHNYPSLLLFPAGRKSDKPIVARSQSSWKKLLVFLKENVAIPFPVSKDDEAVLEEAKDVATEQIKENEDAHSFSEAELIDGASDIHGVAEEDLYSSSQGDGNADDLQTMELNDEL